MKTHSRFLALMTCFVLLICGSVSAFATEVDDVELPVTEVEEFEISGPVIEEEGLPIESLTDQAETEEQPLDAESAISAAAYADETGAIACPEKLSLGLKESRSLPYTLNFDTTDVAITFTSSDRDIVTVENSGRMTGRKLGTAIVTVRASNGTTASCEVTVLKAPAKIRVRPSSLKLGVGETYQLQPEVPSGCASGFTFKTSSKSIVTVTDDGKLTAKKTGNAKIKITSFNGKSTICKITVGKQPTAIRFAETAVSLGIGQTFKPKVQLKPSGWSSTLSYKSSNEKVFTITKSGITAVGVGKATLTVKTSNGLTAACEVTVVNAPTAVKLSPSSAKLSVGMTLPLSWKFSGTNDGEVSCTFQSNKKSVAKVNEKGVVTAVKAGKASVRILTWNGKMDICKIEVVGGPTKIKLNKSKASIEAGKDLQLKYALNPSSALTQVTWQSSNESIATVDQNGMVHALQKGNVSIRAMTANKKKAICKLTVTGPEIKPEKTVTLSVGMKISLADEFPGETLHGFSSENTSIAAVSADGLVNAIKKGEAKVLFTDAAGKLRACTVKVVAAPTKIILNKSTAEINAGDSVALLYKVKATGTPTTITWKSSDEMIATVDEKGVVYGVGEGIANITVVTHNGMTATCKVRVDADHDTPEPADSEFVVENGTIVGYTGEGGMVIIPSADVYGNPITAVASEVFRDRTDITGVTIPTGITYIGESAFEGCRELQNVIISNGVSEMGDAAFRNCSTLMRMTCID